MLKPLAILLVVSQFQTEILQMEQYHIECVVSNIFSLLELCFWITE